MSEEARGKVEVNREECNGCGLCVESCPQKAFKLSAVRNRHGVHPVQHVGGVCSGCGTCRYFCPEPGAITVHRADAYDCEERCVPAA